MNLSREKHRRLVRCVYHQILGLVHASPDPKYADRFTIQDCRHHSLFSNQVPHLITGHHLPKELHTANLDRRGPSLDVIGSLHGRLLRQLSLLYTVAWHSHLRTLVPTLSQGALAGISYF